MMIRMKMRTPVVVVDNKSKHSSIQTLELGGNALLI